MNRKMGNLYGVKIYESGNDDLDLCRICSHMRFLHISEYETFSEYVFYQKCDPQQDNGCNCKEYIPEDNLKYLEYLYDKKSKNTL